MCCCCDAEVEAVACSVLCLAAESTTLLTALLVARWLQNDNFEEYVVNTAAATRPAGGIDFLTAGNAVPVRDTTKFRLPYRAATARTHSPCVRDMSARCVYSFQTHSCHVTRFPLQSAGALTDIFAEGIKASNPGGGAAGANEWTSLPRSVSLPSLAFG